MSGPELLDDDTVGELTTFWRRRRPLLRPAYFKNMPRLLSGRLMEWYGVLLSAAALLLGGCYTYRPLGAAQPLPGTRVSAELTDDGARDLSGQVGPEIEHVEGEVLAVDSTGVELAVRQVETTRGIQSDWKGEKVTIPSAAVSGWQQRRLSVGGTGFLGGLVAGGLYAMYRLFGGPGLLNGRGGGTGPGGGAH